MSILALALVAAQSIFGSSCDAVDPQTGITSCETADIQRAVLARRDSLVIAIHEGRAKKRSEVEMQFATVCSECFNRHLSCGKRAFGDFEMACVSDQEELDTLDTVSEGADQ